MARAAEAEQGEVEIGQDRKDEVRNKLIEIRKGNSMSKFDEGELLAEVLDGSYWDSYAFQSFDEYCAKELGYQKRTGYKRAAVWRTFSHELGYSREALADYQWSKLELIQPIAKKSNVEGWLRDAQKLTFDQLKYKVDDSQAPSGDGKGTGTKTRNKTTREQAAGADNEEDGNEPKVTFRCVMYQSQYDNLKAAIELAGAQLKNDKANYALDMIAADFQASTMSKDDEGASMKRLQIICEDLGRAFNARITCTLNEGAVAEQFKKDRESSKERKKKLRKQRDAQAGDTKDPVTGQEIDPETGEPVKKKSKAKGGKKK